MMGSAFIAWIVSGVVLLVFAGLLGVAVRGGPLGFLLDGRGRYSLTQFQLFLWTLIILSLLSAYFWTRLLGGLHATALEVTIPGAVLAVLGITVGSAATATAIKGQKDATVPASIAASADGDYPRFSQILMVEEGPMADKAIDVTKFQNFWLTIVIAAAYTALAIDTLQSASSAAALTSLPDFSQPLVTLLGISHAGYIAGKLPNRPGPATGLTVADLQSQTTTTQAVTLTPVRTVGTFVPRNPNKRLV